MFDSVDLMLDRRRDGVSDDDSTGARVTGFDYHDRLELTGSLLRSAEEIGDANDQKQDNRRERWLLENHRKIPSEFTSVAT